MRKKILPWLTGLLFATPLAMAQEGGFFADVFLSAWKFIASVFTLNFIGDENELVAFLRLIIFFLILVVTRGLMRQYIGKQGTVKPVFDNKTINIIALAVAAMSVLFFPREMLLIIGTSYALLSALFLIGTVVFLFGYLAFSFAAGNRLMLWFRLIVLFAGLGTLIIINQWAVAGLGTGF